MFILECLQSIVVLPLQPLNFSLVLPVSVFHLRVEPFDFLVSPLNCPFMALPCLVSLNQKIVLERFHVLAMAVLLLTKLLLVLLELLLKLLLVLLLLLLKLLLVLLLLLLKLLLVLLKQLLHIEHVLFILLVHPLLLLFHLLPQVNDLLVGLLIIGGGGRGHDLLLTTIGAFLKLCKPNVIYEI
jgi:hypothetical protein